MDAISLFFNEWLSLIIDVALLVGLFCLWLIWYRNGKRQMQMEQLLIGTAQQLEEATMHLSLATSAIEQLKQQEKSSSSAKRVEPVKQKRSEYQAPANGVDLTQQNLPPQNSTQATMILRMQREGESEEAIADRLDIPLAQVKLMLKLHAASKSSA